MGNMQVFLSHAKADEAIAHDLAVRLTKQGFNVWWPEDKLNPGDNWALEIGKALERSQALVVLLSRESVKSSDVRREIEYALTERQFAHRVVSVVVDAGLSLHTVPWILRKLNVLVPGNNPLERSEEVAQALRKTVPAFAR